MKSQTHSSVYSGSILCCSQRAFKQEARRVLEDLRDRLQLQEVARTLVETSRLGIPHSARHLQTGHADVCRGLVMCVQQRRCRHIC